MRAARPRARRASSAREGRRRSIAQLSQAGAPSAGDAVSAYVLPTLSGMARTATITEEQMPLGVGSLVSLSINICEPLPALVAGGDERSFVLQTASRPGLQGRRPRRRRLEHRRRAARAAHARRARLSASRPS